MPYRPTNLIAENRFVLNVIDFSNSIAVAPTLVILKKEREKHPKN
jgi:hypothetical protein